MPFPFVEAPRWRDRPALVVSVKPLDGPTPLLWVLMITSAVHPAWADDVSLEHDFAACGLPVPCVIRAAKISTIEAARARRLGTLSAALLERVQRQVADTVGL